MFGGFTRRFKYGPTWGGRKDFSSHFFGLSYLLGTNGSMGVTLTFRVTYGHGYTISMDVYLCGTGRLCTLQGLFSYIFGVVIGDIGVGHYLYSMGRCLVASRDKTFSVPLFAGTSLEHLAGSDTFTPSP